MAEKGILERLYTETWPAHMVTSMWDSIRLPGQVAGGQLAVQPSQPGMWSDVDEARQQANQSTMMNRAADLGGLVMGGTYGMAPAGAVGMAGGKAGRAAAGGQVAEANNYFYKGGQFLPITEAPPGSWRVNVRGRGQNIPNGQELVAPGVMEQRPTPFSRSIYQVMGGGTYVDIGPDKLAKLNPNVNWAYLGTTPADKTPVRFKNLAESKEHYSTNDLVELYNKGVRWIDTEPLEGVEVVAKGTR